MLYFQLVIMAGTVMLAYYFECTDTFVVHVQGFFCYDLAYTKPYLGPEENSAVPPVLLYALVAGVPTLVVSRHTHTPPTRTLTQTLLKFLVHTGAGFLSGMSHTDWLAGSRFWLLLALFLLCCFNEILTT